MVFQREVLKIKNKMRLPRLTAIAEIKQLARFTLSIQKWESCTPTQGSRCRLHCSLQSFHLFKYIKLKSSPSQQTHFFSPSANLKVPLKHNAISWRSFLFYFILLLFLDRWRWKNAESEGPKRRRKFSIPPCRSLCVCLSHNILISSLQHNNNNKTLLIWTVSQRENNHKN